MSTRRARKITVAQLERVIGIIGTVVENADLDGTQRDAFASVIYDLDQIAGQGGIAVLPASERDAD